MVLGTLEQYTVMHCSVAHYTARWAPTIIVVIIEQESS